MVLSDGVYDAFVVDAQIGDGGALHLDLTIVSGEHKGEVVSIRAEGLDVDEIEALGTPATITVADGQPSVVLDQ